VKHASVAPSTLVALIFAPGASRRAPTRYNALSLIFVLFVLFSWHLSFVHSRLFARRICHLVRAPSFARSTACSLSLTAALCISRLRFCFSLVWLCCPLTCTASAQRRPRSDRPSLQRPAVVAARAADPTRCSHRRLFLLNTLVSVSAQR